MNKKRDHVDVSVVTAVLNRPQQLERTIESVIAQDCQGLEQIIIDGGSADETLDVLEAYSPEHIRYLSETDDGIFDALNKGLGLARGKHICVLHADDVYLPGAVKAMLRHAARDPDAIWYADCQLGEAIIPAPETITPAIQLYNLAISHQSLIVPCRAFDIIGLYRSDFRIVSDHVWMRDAFRRGLRFRKMPGCHVHLATGGLSSGQTKATRRLFEEEVAARTRILYPFVPDEVLSAIYHHRTAEDPGGIGAWVRDMEESGRAVALRAWSEFRTALFDYLERLSAVRGVPSTDRVA